ncbi:hypothetical protein ACFQ6C_25895 [Streptomyces sp. NPDC056454]|uniref:hypothetical protein n=1 Tax=Streptomyces sp. NPDC056454 TaxID=3345823 RepID=UPI0036AEF2C9
MNIEIKVDDITLDTIVSQALAWDEDEEAMAPTGENVRVGDLVARDITSRLVKDDRWPTLREKVSEIRTEEIRRRVGPMVDEALEGEVRQTNSYGEVTGRPVTFRELVMAEVKRTINESPSSYNSRDKGTVLQIAVRSEVQKVVSTAVAEEVAKLDEVIRQQVAEGVSTDAIAKLIANRLKPQS